MSLTCEDAGSILFASLLESHLHGNKNYELSYDCLPTLLILIRKLYIFIYMYIYIGRMRVNEAIFPYIFYLYSRWLSSLDAMILIVAFDCTLNRGVSKLLFVNSVTVFLPMEVL